MLKGHQNGEEAPKLSAEPLVDNKLFSTKTRRIATQDSKQWTYKQLTLQPEEDFLCRLGAAFLYLNKLVPLNKKRLFNRVELKKLIQKLYDHQSMYNCSLLGQR